MSTARTCGATSWPCCRPTRTRSAAALRAALQTRLGVDVAVVVTDTMGRCWRVGQTDAAIGSAGLTVLHRYGGAVDVEGNELHVTEVALADELAAAADLVKGKLGGVPVAVVRGTAPVDDGSAARDLIRPLDDDLFFLGTEEALATGRRRPCCCAAASATSPTPPWIPPRCAGPSAWP